MAKFCGNCGFQMKDDARVCGMCGASFDDYQDTPQKVKGFPIHLNSKQKKYVGLGLGAVALIIVAVIVVNIITSFTGYNKAVRDVMNAVENYDIDSLVEMTSDLYFLYGEDSDVYDLFELKVATVLDYLEEEAGYDYDFSYKILSAEEVPERHYESLINDLGITVDEAEANLFENVMLIEVRMEADGSSNHSQSSIVSNLYLTKESGDWKLLNMFLVD